MDINNKPIMLWEESPTYTGVVWPVLWWTKMLNRFLIEVRKKTPQSGALFVFDHHLEDTLIYYEPIQLHPRTMLGPTVDDLSEWEDIAEEAIENYLVEREWADD